MENAWLTTDGPGGPLDDLIGHSITYRIAVGPRAGQKLSTLQTLSTNAMPQAEQQGDHRGAVQAGGFSLHAGIDIDPGQRQKLERLCRYVSRPPVAVDRMALTASGQVRYSLKTPYRDGTTHIVLEPLDLMARLAALVSPPRMHLTRCHGVFAPHSKLRTAVSPAGRGKGFDTFGPIGPWLVTADEVGNPGKLDMWLDVNGVSRQRGSTKTMIFDCATLVACVSALFTLNPGDMITTDTPPGVAMGMKPAPVFLKAGDTMTLGIQGLGEQHQKVVKYSA